MIKRLICLTALSIGARSVAAQCNHDSHGNQVCVETQANQNTCGCLDMFGACRFMPVACRDVVIRKTAPDGHAIYTRVLGGESDQTARQFVFDAQDNVVLLGNTYSKQFPVTPDAAQSTNAGPAARSTTDGSNPQPGGDLFLSVLAPAGDLLYSTFLGSSANDFAFGVHAASDSQIDVLAGSGAGDFPVVAATSPAPASGPVSLTFDLNRRKLVRSGYLPISSTSYAASLLNDGAVAVTTPVGLYTFGRDGQRRSFKSLESYGFDGLPAVSTDPEGDVWLTGSTTGRQVVVAKLIGGDAEEFRWMLAVAPDFAFAYLLPPFFGPDGLTYFTGNASLQSTTPNALLESPCSRNSTDIVAVLSGQGEVKLLGYLPAPARGLAVNPDGSVSAVLLDGRDTRLPIDLSLRPKAVCVSDVLDRPGSAPPALAVGQVVRLRGGGFGPDSAVTVDVAGVRAPILSVAPGEAVFAIPFATPEGDAVPVSVSSDGQQSAPLPVKVRLAAPWLVEPIVNPDGTRNRFDSPAHWGSTVTLFLTGAGPYSPTLDDGQVAPADTSRRLQLPVSISFQIAGPTPEPGTILYAGPAPGYLGLAQINVQLPSTRPVSSLQGMLTIGAVTLYLPAIWVQ